AVTITDTHLPDQTQGMSATVYSSVQVQPSSGPGGGGDAGRLPPEVVAALLREEPAQVTPLNLSARGAARAAAPPPPPITPPAGKSASPSRRRGPVPYRPTAGWATVRWNCSRPIYWPADGVTVRTRTEQGHVVFLLRSRFPVFIWICFPCAAILIGEK